jgi:hypothetical protein
VEPVEIEILRTCAFKKKGTETVTTNKRDGTVETREVKRQGCARCGKPKQDESHIGAPSSLNALGSGNPQIYMGMKSRWQALLLARLEASGLPKPLGRVLVEGEATFPDRIRRDQGNYRVLIEKALGDALTEGGWLEDDDWTRYEFGNLAYVYERGVSRTRLMLFPSPVELPEGQLAIPA